jgi:hypothetical protein
MKNRVGSRKQLSPPPSQRLRHETGSINEAPHDKPNSKESNAASQTLTPPLPKTYRYQSRSGLHWLQSSHTEKKGEPPKPDSCFDNKRTRTCSGCYANTRGSESARLSCGHRLCNKCLKSLFRLSDDDERYMPPICCNQGDHIPLRYVDSLFDDRFKLRWNKKYRKKYHSAPKRNSFSHGNNKTHETDTRRYQDLTALWQSISQSLQARRAGQ